MRIGLITHSLKGGGAQQVAGNWAETLAAEGHRVTVLVLDDEPPSSAPTRSWRAMYLRQRSVYGIPARVRAIRGVASRFDALVGVQTYPNLLVLLTTGRHLRVISEHNLPSLYLRTGRHSYRVQLLLARLLYRRASAAISVSHAVAADLITNFHVRPDRSTVLLNGILGDPPNDVRMDPPLRIDLLVAARIAKQKRPWKAVSVARELSARGHNVTLTWVGDRSWDLPDYAFPDEPGLEIRAVPWRDDWVALAGEHTVVLLPSDVEGLGNVLVEAAALGIPGVASSSSLGVGDAVIPGVTGALAASDDDASFADAVLRAVAIRREPAPPGWLAQFSRATTARTFARLLRV